ncbi:MAG: ABC transporter ATP-binding protein, partial [Dichotomicrobium sp.]
MLRWIEQRISPFRRSNIDRPPEDLPGFFWYYARQVWGTLLAVVLIGLVAALIEVSLFAFVGRIVDLARAADSAEAFFSDNATILIVMAIFAICLRPLTFVLHMIVINQSLIPSFTSLVRWQAHRYVLRQSPSFFQDDFAGRIANRVMQTGGALRQAVVEVTDALWFVMIYAVTSLGVLFTADPRLMAPLLIWLVLYGIMLFKLVPKVKERSAIQSDARSALAGRVVDSYANIMTVKLFARTEREDDYAAEALDDHTRKFRNQMRLLTLMEGILWTMNGVMMVATVGLALFLWSQQFITLGSIAVAAGLVIQINNMSGWTMSVVTNVFENIGQVQEGIKSISKPLRLTDAADARPLKVTQGEIRYEGVAFHYGQAGGLIDKLDLTIQPGEKVGLVGRSGAGKSTLVNLLMRFHDLEGGRILVDGQDIAHVTQESLRHQIGMVTQDTSLLHRSVIDNIRYGRPEASDAEVFEAARRAHAHDFIPDLRDWKGRKGYDAHVGERGVKLSGGQRQRIAIARVLLKDAPILVLDEATSALDSEAEAAIQEQLYNLMQGKTVIAIAHRLSTIAMLDRLVVMDEGAIVEQGTHDDLIRHGGIYAQLWSRQSGGFLFGGEGKVA